MKSVKEEREGYCHTEREYGQFYRFIPLPEGVISESAQGTFKNGVLEVSMQAPPTEASRGRRLEIKGSVGKRGQEIDMASGEMAPASSRPTERRAVAGGDMVRKNITIYTLLGIIAVLSLGSIARRRAPKPQPARRAAADAAGDSHGGSRRYHEHAPVPQYCAPPKSGSAGNIGIDFAVPIDTVKTLLTQLRKGKVPRGYSDPHATADRRRSQRIRVTAAGRCRRHDGRARLPGRSRRNPRG